jgi:cardiolipin synthase
MSEFPWWFQRQLSPVFAQFFAVGYALIVLGVAARVIMRRREIGFSLAWLALVVGLPLAGIILYGLFGELKLGRRRAEQAGLMFRPYKLWLKKHYGNHHASASTLARPISELVFRRMGMPCLEGNRLQLLDHHEWILRELIADICQARTEIFMEFYIWESGGQVDTLNQALLEAVKRGVTCRVMVDSVGSRNFLNSDWAQRLREGGVKVVEVLPVGTWRILFQRQDLRMHRKLAIIDRHIGYTGSMNLVDPTYFKTDSGFGLWIDMMVRLTGPVLETLWTTLVWDWELETGERLLESAHSISRPLGGQHLSRAQIIPSGPQFSDDIITQILLHSVYNAQQSICLTTPYFVPEESLAAALKSAAGRGVEVSVILPERSDSLMVRYACNVFIEELVAAGVAIYLFQGGLLHSKSVLVDEQMALIGSVNLDRRSFWLNFEVTLMIDDPIFAGRLDATQRQYRKESNRLTLNRWRKRPWHQRLLENIFYLFSPLL